MQNGEAKPTTNKNHEIFKPKNETRRLRFSFLAPLLLAISAIVATMVAFSYISHQREVELGVVHLRAAHVSFCLSTCCSQHIFISW